MMADRVALVMFAAAATGVALLWLSTTRNRRRMVMRGAAVGALFMAVVFAVILNQHLIR